MACLINSGFADTCRGAAGGVATVWLGNYPAGVTQESDWFTQDGVTGIVTAFELLDPIVQAWEYKPNQSSSIFTESYEASIENGAFGFKQVLNLVFANMSAEKQEQIQLMSAGDLFAIIKDKNGKFWIMGTQTGANLSGGSASTGKVLGDGNKYELEITAEQGTAAYEVDGAAVATIAQ